MYKGEEEEEKERKSIMKEKETLLNEEIYKTADFGLQTRRVRNNNRPQL